MADEIGDKHHNSMRPLKWKCTNECRLLTNRSCIGDKGTISKMHRLDRCIMTDSILQSESHFSGVKVPYFL